MNTTVSILCYKSKVLANGESPLMIRVCKDGKKKYQSIGLSINPAYWDYRKNKPKRNYPNKQLIENLIFERKKEISDTLIELISEKE